jgi:hypothetical protein
MIWQEEAHGRRWRLRMEGWRAVVQQAQGRQRWRRWRRLMAALPGSRRRCLQAASPRRFGALARYAGTTRSKQSDDDRPPS